MVVETKPWILRMLIGLGAQQPEGDHPRFTNYNKLGFAWTLLLLLVLKQVYTTVRDWRSVEDLEAVLTEVEADEDARYASRKSMWRMVGVGLALAWIAARYTSSCSIQA